MSDYDLSERVAGEALIAGRQAGGLTYNGQKWAEQAVVQLGMKIISQGG
jgi:hypothetical protein